MTYSLEFRKKVMAIKEKEKLTYDEAAKRFQIGKTTLVRWHKKLEPQLTRNKPATKINMEALKQDLIRTTMLWGSRLGCKGQNECYRCLNRSNVINGEFV